LFSKSRSNLLLLILEMRIAVAKISLPDCSRPALAPVYQLWSRRGQLQPQGTASP
jgi:hypothetical protein